MNRPKLSLRGISLPHVVAFLSLAALTAGALALVSRVSPGPPATLALDNGVLFLNGTWEIWLCWLLAGAAVLLVAQIRRRPTVATLAVIPLAGLVLWLAHPWLLAAEPETQPFASAEQLGGEGRKTLLIGVDALAWDRLLPLVEAGRLPHFQELMKRGSYGVLESLRSYRPSTRETGYWSPVVWTTIATGTEVRKHGINDFAIEIGNRRPRMAKSHHRKQPAFWNIFSAFHRPVGVVGWWATYPAEKVSGVMVSSSVGLRGHRGLKNFAIDDVAWLRRRRNLTYPEWYKHVVADKVGLPQKIDEWFAEEIFPYREVPLLDENTVETLVSVIWQDQLYLETTLHLLQSEEMSLYATYFEGIDVLNHHFWQYLDTPEALNRKAESMGFEVPAGFSAHRQVVDRYYEVVDGYLGRLIEAAGEDATVIVVSDHGFRNDPDHLHRADHSPWGAILLQGPGIRAGHDLNLSLPASLANHAKFVSVLDVLPTLLYLHGLPISNEIDGQVIYRALERSLARSQPRLSIPSYGDFESSREVAIETDDEDEYLERMKSLGYIR